MSNIKVSELSIYPLKSSKGIALTQSAVSEMGLEYDRRFVLTDTQGQFITGRTHPKITFITIATITKGIVLSAPDMPSITLFYASLAEEYQTVTVWGSEIQGQVCGHELDSWLSRFLGVECRLLYFGEQSQRKVKHTEQSLAFADGYPILLISQASLDELNQSTELPIAMSQFRPNIVVTGCDAFAEDSWKKIRIAGIEFELVKPCERCVFTTLKPNSTEYDSQREPLKSLSLFRKDAEGTIDFGQNLLCHGSGVLNIGDDIEILERHTPKFYEDKRNKAQSVNTTSISHEVAAKTQWDNDETRQLHCVAVIEETPDTKTFRFQVEPAGLVNYKPGQFITLNLKIGQSLVMRNYTLSSSPSRPDLLAITVKRVEGGKASNWLNDNLTVGRRIGASAPRGPFHAFKATAKKLLLLSAGSGITPMLSMARFYADTECDKDIVFLYSAKTQADLIALDELKLLARQHHNMRLVLTLTQEVAQSDWSGFRGRVDKQMLSDVVRDLEERATFVCGPEVFMQTMQTDLFALGLPQTQFFQESFGDHQHSTIEGKAVNILFDSWDTSFTGNNKTTLLEQAENNGLAIPYNCRAGFCGACRVTLEQGEVRVLAEYGLSEEDKQNKQILACSCVPQGDVVISQS